jgi:hypothetical protein
MRDPEGRGMLDARTAGFRSAPSKAEKKKPKEHLGFKNKTSKLNPKKTKLRRAG